MDEPVAWRWRADKGEWRVTIHEPSSVQPLNVDVEPLYVRAQSTGDATFDDLWEQHKRQFVDAMLAADAAISNRRA